MPVCFSVLFTETVTNNYSVVVVVSPSRSIFSQRYVALSPTISTVRTNLPVEPSVLGSGIAASAAALASSAMPLIAVSAAPTVAYSVGSVPILLTSYVKSRNPFILTCEFPISDLSIILGKISLNSNDMMSLRLLGMLSESISIR